MAITSEPRTEEVFEGKGVAIHVAPEGISLTVRGKAPQEEAYRLADYAEVALTEIRGYARADLVIAFGASRPKWVVPRMRRSHAEWAKRAIDERVRRAARRSSRLFSERADIADLVAEMDKMLGEAPVDTPALAEALLTQAILNQASDIHLLPGAEQTAVQWRVDATLREVCSLDREVADRVVARLKVIAGMATYQHDAAQEGRASLGLNGGVEVRMTAMPTLHGEMMTVRIFDPTRGIIPLNELGFEAEDLEAYERIISSPDGMVILTGPAGAGKTTTMYASMRARHERAEATASFATVEEPVEYDLEFAGQTDVSAETDLTFAKALATLLRQDPNVIMVGEIRDPETAEIAVRAGMTGHLVFTTLHTAGASGVFPRLAEMDVAAFVSTSAVRCIVAQRLLRVLCDCAAPAEPEVEALEALGLHAGEVAGWELKRAEGCYKCSGTGYAGRVGVLQVTPVTEALRTLAMSRASAPEIEQKMRELGIPSLHQLALKKAQRGLTSLDEVARVLGPVE